MLQTLLEATIVGETDSVPEGQSVEVGELELLLVPASVGVYEAQVVGLSVTESLWLEVVHGEGEREPKEVELREAEPHTVAVAEGEGVTEAH